MTHPESLKNVMKGLHVKRVVLLIVRSGFHFIATAKILRSFLALIIFIMT